MTGMNQFPHNVIIHPSAGCSWLIPLTISEVQRKEGTQSLLKPRPLSEPSLLLLHPCDLRKSQSQPTKLRVKKKKKLYRLMEWAAESFHKRLFIMKNYSVVCLFVYYLLQSIYHSNCMQRTWAWEMIGMSRTSFETSVARIQWTKRIKT